MAANAVTLAVVKLSLRSTANAALDGTMTHFLNSGIMCAVGPMSCGGAAGPIHMAAPAISFAIGAAVTRVEIPVLCADLAELLGDRRTGVVCCDVSGVARPNVVTVEALARLRLTARRHGWSLTLSGAGPDLRALLRLLGLDEVLTEDAERTTDQPLRSEGGRGGHPRQRDAQQRHTERGNQDGLRPG